MYLTTSTLIPPSLRIGRMASLLSLCVCPPHSFAILRFGAVLRCEISKILLSRTSWLFALSPGNHHNANESRSLSPLISPLPALAAAVRPPVLGSRQLSVTLCLERTPFSHSSRSFSGTAFDPNVIGHGRSCSPTMFWLLYWISVSCRLKYIR